MNKIDPGEPLDKDIYDLEPEELKNVPSTPGSLEEALHALERDHDFLLRGDVFTEDVIDAWIAYKMDKEVKPMALAAASVRVRTVLRRLIAAVGHARGPASRPERGAAVFQAFRLVFPNDSRYSSSQWTSNGSHTSPWTGPPASPSTVPTAAMPSTM